MYVYKKKTTVACLVGGDERYYYPSFLLCLALVEKTWENSFRYQEQNKRTLLGSEYHFLHLQLKSNQTERLLNKPYVNEVTLRGQKPPLKCC